MADEIRRARRAAENLYFGGTSFGPCADRRQRGSRVGPRWLEAPASPYGLVVSLTRPRGPRSIGVLSTLAEDLLDVVGRPYDGVDYVVLDDVRETMLDPAKSDHPLATVGVVAQTPCDVAANLNLHSGLAEVDIAVVAQLKAHHVLHDPVKPLSMADKKVRRSEAIREVGEDGQGERACCWISEHFSPAPWTYRLARWQADATRREGAPCPTWDDASSSRCSAARRRRGRWRYARSSRYRSSGFSTLLYPTRGRRTYPHSAMVL